MTQHGPGSPGSVTVPSRLREGFILQSLINVPAVSLWLRAQCHRLPTGVLPPCILSIILTELRPGVEPLLSVACGCHVLLPSFGPRAVAAVCPAPRVAAVAYGGLQTLTATPSQGPGLPALCHPRVRGSGFCTTTALPTVPLNATCIPSLSAARPTQGLPEPRDCGVPVPPGLGLSPLLLPVCYE